MGVDIPKAFVKWNDYAKSLDKWHLCDEYNELRKEKSAPDQCVSCGKCAEHCPQHIDIPARLAEMTAKVQDAENGMRAYQEQVNKLQSDLTEKEQENANLNSQVKDLQSQIDAMNNPAGAGGDGSGRLLRGSKSAL